MKSESQPFLLIYHKDKWTVCRQTVKILRFDAQYF